MPDNESASVRTNTKHISNRNWVPYGFGQQTPAHRQRFHSNYFYAMRIKPSASNYPGSGQCWRHGNVRRDFFCLHDCNSIRIIVVIIVVVVDVNCQPPNNGVRWSFAKKEIQKWPRAYFIFIHSEICSFLLNTHVWCSNYAERAQKKEEVCRTTTKARRRIC